MIEVGRIIGEGLSPLVLGVDVEGDFWVRTAWKGAMWLPVDGPGHEEVWGHVLCGAMRAVEALRWG